MPELPEVETVRRGLEPILVGKSFAKVEQRRPDLRFPLPKRFAERLSGRRVIGVDRRAKYLLVRLDGQEVLIVHLGMSGRIAISPGPNSASRQMGEYVNGSGGIVAHDHVVFTLSTGEVVTYNDPRRFGFMLLLPEAELESDKMLTGLGVEPLGPEFTAAHLAERAHGRSTDLKAFLMDQRNVAGLGNIYVCEALFRARLSPRRRAASLATSHGDATVRALRLVSAIQDVLRKAIDAGGSSLRDYVKADGTLGQFQHTFAVYDRANGRCVTPECSGTIRQFQQGGRSSFACPECQR